MSRFEFEDPSAGESGLQSEDFEIRPTHFYVSKRGRVWARHLRQGLLTKSRKHANPGKIKDNQKLKIACKLPESISIR